MASRKADSDRVDAFLVDACSKRKRGCRPICSDEKISEIIALFCERSEARRKELEKNGDLSDWKPPTKISLYRFLSSSYGLRCGRDALNSHLNECVPELWDRACGNG